jgi:ABC-2 type transport system permease protein
MASRTRPSALSLVWQQTRYQNLIFWRTPIAAFFTLIFPLLLLFVFASIFGDEEIEFLGLTVAQYYAPALAVFSAASASYTNIGVGTAYQRDQGVLKRVRGTPLPAWTYMAGKVVSATYIAAIAVLIMMTVGVVVYGVPIYARTLPAAIVTFLIGVGSFAALGLVVAALAPSGNAATAITNTTLLPLAFFSGVFIVANDLPRWMEIVGDIFPLKHFNEAFQAAFNPLSTGQQFHWDHLAVMVFWGIGAVVVAVRFFRWEKRPGGSPRSRRVKEPAAT